MFFHWYTRTKTEILFFLEISIVIKVDINSIINLDFRLDFRRDFRAEISIYFLKKHTRHIETQHHKTPLIPNSFRIFVPKATILSAISSALASIALASRILS